MSLAIVQGNGPVLFGQEWLSTIHLFWQSIVFHTVVSKRLDKVLQQFKEVRHVELGSAHTLFYPFESEREYSQTKFVPADQSL